MSALTAPFLVGGVVLCIAGLAKLRSPAGAAAALAAVAIPAPGWSIRAFALGEVALGAWSAVHPSRPAAAAVACLYAMFSGLSLVLARRRASCGCFGEPDVPASPVQAALSLALAAIAVAAAVVAPGGIAWILGQHAWFAATMLIAVGGAVYATVAAYTELPVAWGAWSAR